MMSLLQKIVFKLSNRFIVVIGDEGAVLVHVIRGKVDNAWFTPADSEEGPELFRDFLMADKSATVFAEVDVIEQIFREETLPKANFLDQGKVLKRRLDMAFTDDSLKIARPLPKKDKTTLPYLFISLPLSPWLHKWADFLVTLPHSVSAFSLLPLEASDMLDSLAPPAQIIEGKRRWRALITQQVTGGFRQIIELNGQMVLTRLTASPSSEVSLDETAQFINREFKSSIGYIKRMGYAESDPFDLVILCGPGVREAIEFDPPAVSSLTVLTPFEAGERLGFSRTGDPETPYSDILHALWQAQKFKPTLTLRSPAIEKIHRIHMLRRYSPLVAIAITLGQLLYASDIAVDVRDNESRAESKKADAKRLREQLDQQMAHLKKSAVPLEEMSALMQLNEELKKQGLPLQAVVNGLAQSLGPDERVSLFDVAIKPAAAQPSGPGAPPRRPGLPPPQPAPANGQSAYPRHALTLAVEFPGLSDQPVRALDASRDLSKRLEANFPGYKLEIVKLPVNVLPGQTFSGTKSAEGGKAQPQRADFSLQGGRE